MEKQIALITGASSGIGYATALTLGKMGYDLLLPQALVDCLIQECEVERGVEEPLQQLGKELGSEGKRNDLALDYPQKTLPKVAEQLMDQPQG